MTVFGFDTVSHEFTVAKLAVATVCIQAVWQHPSMHYLYTATSSLGSQGAGASPI